MANLKIYGWGLWLQVYELDEDKAQEYAESGVMPESEYDEFVNEAEGEFYAFSTDAVVLYNDTEIGTISSLVEKAGADEYPGLHEALNASGYELDRENAFVYEQGLKGCFVDAEIPDYDIESAENLPPSFLNDFLSNLYVENGRFFSLTNWDDEELSSDDSTDTQSDDAYVIYDGKRYNFEVDESED
jgi:hypothetical protein